EGGRVIILRALSTLGSGLVLTARTVGSLGKLRFRLSISELVRCEHNKNNSSGSCRAIPCYLWGADFRRVAMIHHLSIAAANPKQAADVLAELMGGKAVPFPPNPGSFFALQLDEHGSGVEVYPAGTELEPGGEVGGSFMKREPRGYGSTHFALSVKTDPDT